MITLFVLAVLGQGPPPDSLTLASALAHAFRARGQVRVAAANVAEARAGHRLAGEVPNPSVGFSKSGDAPRQHFTFDQSLSWLMTRGALRSAASATIDRALRDSAVTVATVAQEVRIAFYSAVASEEGLRLVREQVAIADSVSHIARRRYDAGDISLFEVEQIGQEARRAQQLLSEAGEQAQVAAYRLARAIGWSGVLRGSLVGRLDDEVDSVPEQWQSETADALPLVGSAVADSVAAAQELQFARRARIPIPSFEAGTNWDDPSDPGRTFSVIGFTIPFPIWQQGGGSVAEARARAERAAALASEVRLDVRRQVAEAEIRLLEARRRARFARDSLLPGARHLRELAVEAYRAGQTGILPVLDALRGEREVALGALQELVSFQSAVATWRALLGRVS